MSEVEDGESETITTTEVASVVVVVVVVVVVIWTCSVMCLRTIVG